MKAWILVGALLTAAVFAAPVPVGPSVCFNARNHVYALAVSPDSKLVAIGTVAGTRILWDHQRDVTVARKTESELGAVASIAFDLQGRSLLVHSIWMGQPIHTIDGRLVRPENPAAKNSKPGPIVVYHPGYWLSNIRSVGIADLSELSNYADDVDPLEAATFATHAKGALAVGRYKGEPAAFFSNRGEPKPTRLRWYPEHGDLRDAQVTPDGRIFAALMRRAIQVVDVSHARPIAEFPTKGLFDPCRCWLAPDGRSVAVTTVDHRVAIWDLNTKERCFAPVPDEWQSGTAGFVEPVAFAPGSGRVAVGLRDGRVLVWDRKSRQTVRFLRGPKSPVTVLACSPDGTWVFAGCPDGTVWRWRMP